MPEATNTRSQGWTVFVAVSIILIGNFLWRFFTPAHEYPMRTAQVLDIGLDTLLLVSLVGMRLRSPVFRDESKRSIGNILFWLALAAGIGLFLIRLSSDAAWWTGHRLYWLTPR